MARLWSSGFELNTLSALVEISSNSSGAIVTSPVRSGTYALQFSSFSGTTQKTTSYQFTTASIAHYSRAYVHFSAFPNSTTKIFGNAVGSGSIGNVYFTISSAGVLEAVNNFTTTTTHGTTTLSLNTWYRLEFFHNAAQASGSQNIEWRVDGTALGSVSTGRSTGSAIVYVILGRMEPVSSGTTGSWTFDDLAINDTSGSVQNSWPGDGKVVHLQPNAAGDNNSWETSGGGAGSSTNYQAVDEVTPDDVTTYLARTAGAIRVDDYAVMDSSTAGIGSSDAVTLVQVGVRGGAINATASPNRDILLRIKSASGGTVVKSGSSTNRMNVNGWVTNTSAAAKNYQLTAYVDPTTGVAWTPTGTNSIDNMQIGAENQVSILTETRISTLWALVEYVPYVAPAGNDNFFFSS